MGHGRYREDCHGQHISVPIHGMAPEFYPQVSSYPETKCITMFHADTAIRPSWVYFITSDQIPKKRSINILPEQVT
jgi:hypothetical protein